MRVLLGRDAPPSRKLTVRWLFEPRDLWLGVFWNTTRRARKTGIVGGADSIKVDEFLLVYVGLIPCLPFCIAWRMA